MLYDLDEQFHCGDGYLSLAGSLYAGGQIFVTPLIAFLVKKHGWRAVSIFGCLLNALGFFIASQAVPNSLFGSYGNFMGKPIVYLYLGLVISSFGACAMTHTGNLAVGLYFKEKLR